MAERFAAAGASVVINSRDGTAVKHAVDTLGDKAIGVEADVSTADGAALVVSATVTAFGRIDVMICNAGRNSVVDAVDLTPTEWQDVMALNLDGVFFTAQAAGREMLKQGTGCVITIGSIAGSNAFPRRVAYNCSKAAVEMLSRVLAIEWAPTVRVNCIAPGYVRTDLIENLRATGRLDYDGLIRRTPMRRFGEGAEIADAALFLASDRASFMTGSILTVDGGWSAYGFV
jgi:NAD(P)-dependent dehydrogenase (short-subunit alcohol dehydrogenase family)